MIIQMKTIYLILLVLSPSLVHAFGIDLHAHLFMDDGMNILFKGKFSDSKIKAKNWKDSRFSQVNVKMLEETPYSIVVVSLYALPVFNSPVKKYALKQISEAEKFVKNHPNWIIAHSSTEAKNAISLGKKVMVLSLEGAHGYLNTDGDIDLFYKKGVRIVTLMHLTDDKIGGTAFLKGAKDIFVHPTKPFCREKDSEKITVNCKGLSSYGKKLVQKLIKKGFWIDLTHSSDHVVNEIIPLLEENKSPLLFTHTVLRKFLKAERGISSSILKKFKTMDGMIGLLPSADYLGNPPLLNQQCQKSIDAYQAHFQELLTYLTPEQIAFGSDTNGMINHLRPRLDKKCPTPQREVELDVSGFWNFSHGYPLMRSLSTLGSPVASPDTLINKFLALWNRVERQKN